ncbi:hypothetical protein [Holospora curviuscula]|uniref:Uncharacterized protein n=1 Tax=Holospora curviuscula TaxID=1082868 RepID=A0A2S5R8A8_9PROT|nr:hypothetical protein [Holospora curviuscula]PPE03523.1 hypothetical protein HCUR_01067 [Holospora curviuscula]
MKKIIVLGYVMVGFSIPAFTDPLSPHHPVHPGGIISAHDAEKLKTPDARDEVLIAFRDEKALPGIMSLLSEIRIILSELEGTNTEAKEALNSIEQSISQNSNNPAVLEEVLKKMRTLYSQKQLNLIKMKSIY